MKQQIKLPEISANSLEFIDDRIQHIVDQINNAFVIQTSAFDPSKFNIVARDADRYKFQPTVDTVYWYLRGQGIQIGKTDLRGILREPNFFEPENPILGYFDGIRGKYKGESHIDLLCSHLSPRFFEKEPAYYAARLRKILRKWMVASVAQWIDGVPNPVNLGFVAMDEYIGKTFLTKFLCPPELQHYYVQLENNDRFVMSDFFARYMFICFDELVGLNKGAARIEEFKKYMREPTVLVQRRYEDFPQERARIAVAMFTSNRVPEMGGFLSELHGYSRFAIIELDGIDKSYSLKVDVSQMWAEALMLHENADYDSAFNDAEITELVEYNKRYMIQNEEMKYVQLYLVYPGDESDDTAQWCTPSEVVEILRENRKIINADANKLTPQKVGYALTSMGYEKRSKRKDGEINPAYRYRVKFNFKLI